MARFARVVSPENPDGIDVPFTAEEEALADAEAAQSVIDDGEFDVQEYARNRRGEYPTIAELTVALYDTDDKAALVTKRAAVKTKWPKDNSGPV